MWPVSSLRVSVTCTADMTLTIGMITPAVSQVGALAGAGISSKMQRRHSDWCGRMVIETPYEPMTAP